MDHAKRIAMTGKLPISINVEDQFVRRLIRELLIAGMLKFGMLVALRILSRKLEKRYEKTYY